MYLFYLLVLLVPLLALRKREATEQGDILDSRSTTCIKGILCFYVMLHNLGLDLEGNSELKEQKCEYTGGIGVGVFFFLSAFGIIRSYQKKGNKYLKKLLLVNVPRLYIISVAINFLTYFVCFRGAFEGRDLFMRLFNLDFFNDFNRMNRHGWYITTIITLYIIFAIVYFLCSRLKTDKKFIIACVIISLITLGFDFGTFFADKGGTYTREIDAFIIGCVYATFYDKINCFANKYFVPGMIISSLGFVVGLLFCEPPATYAATLIVILVSQRYTYYSSITHFFGKICIGVYLFLHFSSIILNVFLSNEYLWVLINAAFIIELSVILYAIEICITKAIKYVSKRITVNKEHKETTTV